MKDQVLVLRYLGEEKEPVEIELAEEIVTIGRAPDSTIMLTGDKISRRHAEIRHWDGDYIIKDLNSKNGIRVNAKPVKVAILHVNDIIDVGPFQISVDTRAGMKSGQTEAIEVLREMEEGKGYRTILRQIVDDVEEQEPSAE